MRRQCAMLGGRTRASSQAATGNDDDLEARRRIDALSPRDRSRGATDRPHAERGGLPIDRKRVRRLMRLMGIEARAEAENDQARSGTQDLSHLLRDLAIERPNQVGRPTSPIPIGRGSHRSASSTGEPGGLRRLSNTRTPRSRAAWRRRGRHGEPDISTPTKAASHQRGSPAC